MLQNIRNKLVAQKERNQIFQQPMELEQFKQRFDQLKLVNQQEDAFNREALITLLTTTTAVIHVYLGGTLFVLNGVGFLALLAAHYAVPQRESYKKWTRDALFTYTGFTFVGYFVVKGLAGWTNPLGIATKLVELGLLRVLSADRKAAEDAPMLILQADEQLDVELIAAS
jgi:hypothetical protein